MVKIECGRCGYVKEVSDKYAGKRVLCPKCKAVVQAPGAYEPTATEQTNLIKFRCPHCNQKIGLPLDYAGKQVRCAKCKNATVVPQTPSATKTSPLTKKASYDFNPFDNIPDFEFQPNAPSADVPLRLTPVNEPTPQSEYTDISGRIPSSSLESAGPAGNSMPFRIDNTPIALLASVVFVIIGGMFWGLLAKYTEMEFGLAAWGIGALAGLGIYLFTASRGVFLGIVVALIALFGIFSGKFFVAKWYYMPEMMSEFREKGASDFVDTNNIDLSQEEIRKIISDPGQMFRLASMQLADDGEITKEDAEYGSGAKTIKALSQSEQDPNEKPDEAQIQEQEQRRKDVEAKVYKYLAEWDEDKKIEVVRTQYPKMMKEFADAFAKSPIMNVVGFAVAYISAFSLFDLLWFPIAMGTAYKFGTGENS